MTFERLGAWLEVEPDEIEALLRQPDCYRYSVRAARRRRPFVSKTAADLKMRRVFEPKSGLLKVQEKIRAAISPAFSSHSVAHGYVKGRSIISNAKAHVGVTFALHVDFADFFGSIKVSAVRKALSSILGEFEPEDIDAVANLCCYRGFLPQGAPTSPLLSNLVCYSLDERLDQLALSFGCRVTRYADDITFSVRAKHFPRGIAEVSLRGHSYQIRLDWRLRALIERHGFKINTKKVRFENRSDGVFVTGLAVGDRVTVPLAFRRFIRAALHNWKMHGIDAVARNHNFNGTAEAFEQSLRGCIGYVGQVMGRDDPQYQKFLASFETLARARERQPIKPSAMVSWME